MNKFRASLENTTHHSYQINLLGWGRTTPSGPSADILQQATLPVASQSDCSIRNGAIVPIDERSMLCAGGQGTSGGCNVREVDTRKYQALDTLLILIDQISIECRK